MRLLTTDELFAVSGGSINGGDDPMMLDVHGGRPPSSATSTVAFFCEKIVSRRKQDDCWLTAAKTASCPGGWRDEDDSASAGSNGVSLGSSVVECKTNNSSDSGSNDDSGDDSGSDNGKDD